MKFIRAIMTVLFFLVPSLTVSAANVPNLYNVSFPNVDNETVNLSKYKGKVVLLNFWATWCPPCVKEMPSMQRMRDHFSGQPFEIIAINTGENATSVSSFLLELDTELTFPILLDLKSSSYKAFNIRGLPMSLLFDKKGNLVKSIIGGKEWDHPAAITLVNEILEEN